MYGGKKGFEFQTFSFIFGVIGAERMQLTRTEFEERDKDE